MVLNPKTTHFEFFGTPGTAVITFGFVILINFLYFGCNAKGCSLKSSVFQFLSQVQTEKLISWEAFTSYTTWLVCLIVLDRVLPGQVLQGQKLRTGQSLTYKFNGTLVTILLNVILLFRAWQTNLELPELQFVYDHFIELANVTLLYSFTISTWLYLRSFTKDEHGNERLLALGGNSGIAFYDWFIGRELNPRIGDFDIKSFLEMRPGLLLWMVINYSMAHHQYLKYGRVSDSMILVNLFQNYYVAEGTVYEAGLLSMIDIVTDGLGYMLVFGDISVVPFTYTVQARYLADHPIDLGYFACAVIFGVYILGIFMFRSANNEKSRFRNGDPSTNHLKFITAESGTKLLVSGWWGFARHINYTGDWLASLAYSLPCLNTALPYYYVIYFAVLLIHRETRDEAKCSAKYGKTWVEYKRRVPYRMIPGIY